MVAKKSKDGITRAQFFSQGMAERQIAIFSESALETAKKHFLVRWWVKNPILLSYCLASSDKAAVVVITKWIETGQQPAQDTMVESETHQTVINLSSFMSWVAEQGDQQAVHDTLFSGPLVQWGTSVELIPWETIDIGYCRGIDDCDL